MAAEYVLKEGNEHVMLCERGIRTFETAYRFTLDLLAVPVLQEMTHLPMVVDPSHAPGAATGSADVAGRRRGRRRRDHRRGPQRARRGDLRRPAGAADREFAGYAEQLPGRRGRRQGDHDASRAGGG